MRARARSGGGGGGGRGGLHTQRCTQSATQPTQAQPAADAPSSRSALALLLRQLVSSPCLTQPPAAASAVAAWRQLHVGRDYALHMGGTEWAVRAAQEKSQRD
jgi:hypothetical protein